MAGRSRAGGVVILRRDLAGASLRTVRPLSRYHGAPSPPLRKRSEVPMRWSKPVLLLSIILLTLGSLVSDGQRWFPMS